MAIYFTDDEIYGLDEKLVLVIDCARHMAGVPFVITEGVGSGGSHVGNTAHKRGLAVDLRCRTNADRMVIVRSLLSVGVNRMGIYDLHIHADIDPSLPQNVMWWGKSK